MRFCVLILAAVLAGGAQAAPLRVASINMCADQLLQTLADPEQIVGLGPYSRDKSLSGLAEDARKYRRLSGEAEDIIALKPDLVLAGKYGKKATRDLLGEHKIKVLEFDVPRGVDEVKTQARRVGEIVGHPERAEALIAKIDAAVLRAKAAATQSRARVMAVARRGWVAGDNTLLSSLLATLGLTNAASALGLKNGGFVSLETLVAARPDFVLVAEAAPSAEDQGKALLLHPALDRAYPPERRIVLPEQLTICGGPMLPAALDRLTEAMATLTPKPRP